MNQLTDLSFSLKDILFTAGEFAGALVVGLVLGVVSVLKKKNIKKFFYGCGESKKMQAHTRVHETLTELRIMVRASRSIIFQYHNGGKFADGTSIKRFSVTHESCAAGTPGLILESQDVLITRYMELIDILEDRANQIISVSSLPDCSLRSILEINNVVHFSVGSLKCQDSLTPMGFVCCHWCDDEQIKNIHEEGITNQNLEDVIETSTRIINNHLIHAHK